MPSFQVLSKYHPVMYRDQPPSGLQTGDIVRLELDEFKRFVRYESIIKLIEHFYSDKNYIPKLWAILNKPCDMVHEPENNRVFKSNLFLAPLLSFKAALRKGVLAGEWLHFDSVPEAKDIFLGAYGESLLEKAMAENPKGNGEKKPDHIARVRPAVDPIIERLKQDLQEVGELFHDPTDVLNIVKEFTKDQTDVFNSLVELESSAGWKKSVEEFRAKRETAEKKDGCLILNKDAVKKRLAELCLNQMDSQGVFYFEPHTVLAVENFDFSYVILLQDMLTLKIDQKFKDSGEFSKLLHDKRVISLTENFSDRLLNIMGNYFSKIGTDDVMSDRVLALYTNAFEGEFFPSLADFEKYDQSKKAASPKSS